MNNRVQTHRKSGITNIVQAAFFGLAVLLATGCASTGGDVRTGLIAPVTTAHQGSVQEDDGFYQPPRSPGFNDLTGS